MDLSINKIVERWFRHVMYVFTAIILVFFQIPFNFVIEKTKDVTGAEAILEATLKMLPDSIRPISFLSVVIFLGLIVYTTCIVIKIIKKSTNLSINRFILWYCFLPILFNSIFIALISLIGIHCLQIKNTKIWHPFIGNVFLQMAILLFFVPMNYRMRLKHLFDVFSTWIKRWKWKITIILIALALFFCINHIWIREIISPVGQNFIDRFNCLKMFKILKL
jgi:hypothetical protein